MKSMDIKTLISYYMDIKLRKVGVVLNGHKIEVSENEKDILKVVEKLCAQMEGDARFEDILLSFRKFGVSKETFLTVLDQLLIGDLNWSRVLSVIALSGELAVQCVERDEEHKIDLIQDCAIAFADVKLKDWIIRQGGLVNKVILSTFEDIFYTDFIFQKFPMFEHSLINL